MNLAQHAQPCAGRRVRQSPKASLPSRRLHVVQFATTQVRRKEHAVITAPANTTAVVPSDGLVMSEPMRALIARILDDTPVLGLELDAPQTASSSPSQHMSLHKYNPQSSSSSDDADDDSSDTETCITAHPGSVCCTTTTVEREPANKTVVIHLKTTVRLTSSNASSVSMSDLEQLGLMAGAQQLQAAASALAAGTASHTIQSRHDAVLAVLARGRVVSAEKFTNQFGHVTFRCVLEDEQTKQRMHAMVKPTIEGHCHGWHRAEIEAVAYRLNRLLGMDYVPPCVYRKEMDLDWQHYEHGGTFMYWAEEGRELRTQPMNKWGLKPEVLLSDTRILDVLIQNSDRHHGHFLIAEHWAHGTGASSPAGAGWKGTPLPVLIDHAAGFRAEAFVDMRHDNAFNTGETNRVSARTFLRLRCLDRAVVADALNDLLTPAEIDQVMKRRDEILQYFDRLVEERTYERVVMEV